MRRAIGLLAMLLAVPVRGQMVESWPPAYSDVHATLLTGEARTHVMLGVPGEVMQVRLIAKAPASAASWVVDLLQPDAATQSFVAGPGGAIAVPPVVFGDSGAVALRLSSSGGSGGDYALRARGHLPPGFKHPDISLAVEDASGAFWMTDSWLRPGLELRARVRLSHDATGWPADVTPHFQHFPPSLVGGPFGADESPPRTIDGKPYPDVITFTGYSLGYEHVFFDLAADEVTLVGARVRRKKVVLGKSLGASGSDGVVAPIFRSVDLDQSELAPGASTHLIARVKSGFLSQCPGSTQTARVWLSSVHRIHVAEFGGALLAGPLEVPVIGNEVIFETDIEVPADTQPGLWGVWVVLGDLGGGFSCNNLFPGAAAETVLRVLAP